MFKAKKVHSFSQKTQSQVNSENESENIPLGQRLNTPQTEKEDEDVFVAPSQEPSLSFAELRSQRNDRRRFMSQRSQMRHDLSQSQGVSVSKKLPKSYFEQLLIQTGVNYDNDYYLLDCDFFRFQCKFDEAITKANNYPANIPIILDDIKALLAKSDYEWRKLMAIIRFEYPYSEENPEPIVHESITNSMFRFLLLNHRTQKLMLKIYFEEIRKRVKPTTGEEFLDFVLVVNQMKMVDFRDNADYINEQYFETLAECNVRSREVMICGMDDFVERDKQTAAIEEVLERIPKNDELLTPKHLETFAYLTIETLTLNKLRARVFHYMTNDAPKILLYDLFTFLAKFNDDEHESYYEVINDIREAIKWDMEDTEIKVPLLKLVHRMVNRCPVTRRNWLKAILYVTNAKEHKVIDPLVCFMIGSYEDDYATIESFFKKRVKEKYFTIDLIQQMSRRAAEVLPVYLTVMTDIFKACFVERDKYISFFGSIGFRILFKINGNVDLRYPLQTLIRLACLKASEFPFMMDNNLRTSTLELLLEIKKRFKNQADGGFAQVEKILDRSSNLTIDQYRILIKLMCSLAYDGTGSEHIKGDLDLMAPKQVTNMHLRSKLQGIIIVFQILDRTMWTETPEQDDSLQMSNESNSTISLSQIPNDNDLNNARLIKLTLKSSEHLVDALMLFHDELSTIVSTRNKSMTYGLNYKFVKWLYDQILNTFQDSFIVTECPKGGEEDIPMEYFFSINSANDSNAYEELNTDALDIGINIAGIVLGSSATKTQLQLMCPMFHSLSSLTYRRYSTSLDTISALLGCSLVLPKNFLDEEKLFEDLETVAIDLYFHVANWLRCVISAFVSQNARCMKKKVLKRINQLIDIEASVKFLLQKVDLSYEAPPITFQMKEDFNFIKPAVPKRKGDTDSEEEEETGNDPTDGNEPNFNEIDFEEPGPSKKKAKKTKKKKKKQKIDDEITEFDEESMNINLNETLGNLPVKTQIATQGTQSAEIVKHRAKYWFSYGKQEKYRQLDIDLMILLEEPLEIAYDLPETEVGNNLTLQELKFVVADLISKTESLAGVKKFRVDQQTQQIVCVHAFMYDLVSSVKHLVRFKNKLGDFIYEKIREMEADESIPRLCELLSHAKICFGAIFHLFGAIFSWPNFIIDDHQKMLRTAMTEILEMPPQEVDSLEMEEIEIEDLAEKTLEKIVADEPRVMDLRSSVHLLHCVKAVSRYADKPEAIVNLAEVLLKREWIALDGTKEFSKNSDLFLTELLKCFMREMELPKLEDVINGAAAEMIALKTKADWMTLYPNFNRSNCTIFYRVVAITCESSMKHCIATVARTADLIECWMRCFHVLQALLTINEENPILTNTSTFLKYSHSIMKVFRGNGVKTMEKMAERDPHAVQDLLKAMQKTTRFLHSITVDTKAKISSRVLTQVPKIRETMEKLVLEVKAALATNHSLSGFWVSNLHNKNGTGDVLLSQIQNAPQEEREADEEPEIEDDLNSPENSDADEEGEASSTPSMASSVVSRPSKIFD